MANQQKQVKLQNLIDLIQKAPHFVLVKYEKISHITLEELRKRFKKTGSHFKVIKNSLFTKALNRLIKTRSVFPLIIKTQLPLKQNTAIISFPDDFVSSFSAFYQFMQKEKGLQFKFGLLDEQLYLSEDLIRIAKLPGKNQLIANVAGLIKSPSNRFIFALKYNINKLAQILKTKTQVN